MWLATFSPLLREIEIYIVEVKDMAEKLKHNLHIATYIRKAIRAGVAMKVILDEIQKYDNAPSSMNGMYKTYRQDIATARAEIQELVGTVVVNKALDGDLKAAELFLRSKAGWNPTIKVEEVDPEEVKEDTGAIDDLLALLGKKRNDKTSDND
jgi:hypothetical protein